MAQAKLSVIIEAQNQAKRQLDNLSDQLRKVSNDQRNFADASADAEQSFLGFTSQIGLGVIAANLVTDALRSTGRALKNFIGSSIETALSVERIAATLPVLAKNTGKTTEEINKIIFAIRNENKSIREATEVTRGIVLAGLDEVAALKLITIARDVGATVGRTSADVNRLILESFQTLTPGVLKQVGINISLRETYRALAEEQDTEVASLTTLQRQQGLLNAIFVEGDKFAGAYAAAMTTVQKVTNSAKDASEDIKFVLGSLLTEGFFPIAQQALDAVRAFRAWAITSENVLNPQLQALADTIGVRLNKAFDTMLVIIGAIVEGFRIAKQAVEDLLVIESVKLAFEGLAAVWNETLLPVLKFLLGDVDTLKLFIQALVIAMVLLVTAAILPLVAAIIKTTAFIVAMIAIVRLLKGAFTALFFAAFELARAISQAWTSIVAAITGAVTAVKEAIMSGFAAIQQFLASTWQNIKNAAFSALESIVQKVRDVISTITAIPRAISRVVGGVFSRARGLVGLQEGGIVTRPTRALIGEAGPEAVIPLRRLGAAGGLGGANVTVNINGAVFSDDAEQLARTVGDAIIDRLGLNIRVG